MSKYITEHMDAFEQAYKNGYLNGYEQGAKDYKEQRDLVLQENAELFGKIEQLEKELEALKAIKCGECIIQKIQ